MSIPTPKDRSDYRCMRTRALMDTVRYALPGQTDWQELAIALAERLHSKELRWQEQVD